MVYGDLLTIILLLFWIPQAIRQVAAWLYWWQIKEYRLDRVAVFLSTKNGRRNLGLNLILLKFISVFLSLGLSAPALVLPILLLLDVLFFKEVLRRGVRKPVFTQRAINILLTVWLLGFLEISWGLIYKQSFLISILLAESSMILGIFIGVAWTSLISGYIKKIEIKRAKKVLLKARPVVIGVTGSYGKTSTKEFIAHLLSLKFKVAKTEGSQNTEFALARSASGISKGTNFFVVEMGAYKKNEIKRLAEIVNPTVGVITGVEPQHLSLFGSLQKIMDTKFELIEVLPVGGIAIFNLSNRYSKRLYDRAKKLPAGLKVMGYRISGTASDEVFVSRIVSSEADGVHFVIEDGQSLHKMFAPVSGEHFVENLTVAIMVARQFGVSWYQIRKGCRNLPQIEKRMRVLNVKKAVVIDDSFNASPKSFTAAIGYLDFFKDRIKIVVTAGIIELGKETSKIHRNLGKLMSDRVDEIILLDDEYYKDILLGIGKQKKTKISVVRNTGQLEKEIEDILEKNSALLLEGKMPSVVDKLIEKNKNA